MRLRRRVGRSGGRRGGGWGLAPAAATLAILGTLAGVAGCGDEPATTNAGESPDDLRGRTFVSTRVVEDGQPRELAEGSVVRVEFTDDGRLVSNAGCNTGQGTVRLDGGRIVVDNYGMTEMGCSDELADQDTWLAEFFGSRPTWRLSGHDLTLRAEGTRIIMTDREVAEPDRPLEGTTWRLDGFVADTGTDDATASHSAAMEQAWLRITDGRVEAHSGCNGLGGDVTVEETNAGYRITFGPLIGTKMACEPEVMEVERQLTEVLAGTVTATVDANRLRLVNANGAAADLVATDDNPGGSSN